MTLPQPYYQDDAVTLYHGDCLDLLPHIGPVDHVLTDPPYDERTHENARCNSVVVGGVAVRPDGVAFAALPSASRVAATCVPLARRWSLFFCAVEMLADYRAGASDSWVRAGVWDRVNPSPQLTGDRPGQAVEGVAIFHAAGRKRWNGGGTAAIWRHQVDRGAIRPDHPTPKPLALMRELVRLFTDPGDVILDPFAGSATTGLAARLEGRRAILIEREERYCEVSAKRLERMPRGTEQQPSLFAEGA
jgi:hypothetical protein